MAGYVITVEKLRMDKNYSKSIHYRLSCGGYASYLERVRVKEEYEDKTDAYNINDILTTYAADYDGTTYVTALKTYANKRFNRKTVYEVIDELATDAGASWYVDADKKLHYFINEESLASYNISDTPDLTATFPASDIRIYNDGSGVVNRVEVIGGNYLSDDQTDYYMGTGQSNRISLTFKYVKASTQTAVLLYRNDGTEGTPSWTPLTVKVGHIDTISSTDEALYYYQEQAVEQVENFPNLPNALKIVGRYDVPLRLRKRNQASFTHYGKWFDGVLINENIISKVDADIAGTAVLSKNALASTSIECKVRKHGLRAGQTIHVTNVDLGLDADYLIHQVYGEIRAGGYAVYDLTLGTYNPELIDYMLALVRATKATTIWREDEVLDEVLDVEESLPLAESYNNAVTSAAPYTWGPDGANDFAWGFGKWSST